jgi:hypothetical protein
MSYLPDAILGAKLLSLIVVLATVVVAFAAFFLAMLALRAKSRAHNLLSQQSDEEIRILMQKLLMGKDLDHSTFTSDQLETITKFIEERTKKLSAGDRRVISYGLRQQSRRGAERFAREMLTGSI